MTFEGGEDEVEISAARSRFVVRTTRWRTSRSSPTRGRTRSTLPAPALAEALRQVVRAASNDDARPLLTGVLVAAEGGGPRLVATDSYRLAMRDLAGEGPLAVGAEQILVPARALTELQRLMPAAGSKEDGDATVGFSVSELDATFTVGGVRLITRLLDGKFPDYRQLIPPGYPNLLRVGRDALLDGAAAGAPARARQHHAGAPVHAARVGGAHRGVPGGRPRQ